MLNNVTGMKIIRNKFIPFPGYKAINLFGAFLFVKGNAKIDEVTMNHVSIHGSFVSLWFSLRWLPSLSVVFRILRVVRIGVAYKTTHERERLQEHLLRERGVC